MREILAKAIIIFLALLVASILVAPSVNLDPAAPRLEWAACLLVIFLAWLTALFSCVALFQTLGPLALENYLSSGFWRAHDAPLPCDRSSSLCFRC